MKLASIAPLSAALFLAGCSGNESADSSTANGDTASGSSDIATAVDADTPAGEFALFSDAKDCLGIAWTLGDDASKDLVRAHYARTMGGREFHRENDAFAKRDYVASLEPSIVSMAAPHEGRRLYAYTTEIGDDPYREYDFDTKSFFDSSKILWGGNPVFLWDEGKGGKPARCHLEFSNRGQWAGVGSGYYVPDEQEARAASEALAAGKSAVKVYFHVDKVDVGDADTVSAAPKLNASIVRIELVDAEGKRLATALPAVE